MSRPRATGDVFGEDSPYQAREGMTTWGDTNLHATWEKRMRSENDFIVAIAASSTTEISGTGKTTLAIQLARHFDDSPTPFDAAEQASLSSEEVAKEMLPDLTPRSSIVFDEAQGTAQSEGVDARKAMANEVIELSRAVAGYRYKQPTLIISTQSTRWLDSRLMDLIDRIILIQETNHDEGWARAIVFDHWFDDLASERKEYHPAKEDIYWRPLPGDDEDYQVLHKMKEESSQPDGDGEEEEDTVSIAELADQIRESETLAQYLGWHGGHHKWVIKKDRLRDGFDLTHERAQRLKDHLREDPAIDVQAIGDAEKEAPA
jgi:hypothetical protein